MKKTTVLAAALATAAAAFGGMKIGTVDMVLLVRNHSSYETNKELLQGMEKEARAQLDEMKKVLDDLQDQGRALDEELQNPMLAAAAKTKAEKDIADVQRKYVQQQQKMRDAAMQNQQKLSETEATLLKSQAGDLKKRIADFAKKNDYDLVLDSSAAIYSDKDMDVTDAVLEEMGVDPKAARAKEKNEGK